MIVGLGLDLVEIARVGRLLERHGARALARLFTPGERALHAHRHARHLAGRIAAKEAAYKALSAAPGAQAIGWTEIEVVARDGTSPGLALHGRALQAAVTLGVTSSLLTLTHSETTAGAVVILQR